ncbi:YbjQ family protein [Gelidibacter salicanalis]|uniref:Heavy metal-binding domain-containing protein n=1 Tax=Gelidibacter salicanalis TaxID=291193 RepID=A0A934KS26_9FLAO|nr:heavy metal-binding domain-containing protein [Gelidibacter salicanalis]MBJ7879648.1 heavy metal-binding domain-containing protein [Gelidibacter salicanalis]
MILTTTNSIEGFKILEYKGIVSGISVNAQKMTMTFNVEKYYEGVGVSMSQVKEQAFQQLQDNARNLNANAIVGIKVDIEVTASNYIAVSVTGTAVSVA